jgi:hypothetical protein
LFIIDLLATLVTRADLWAVLASVVAARRSPALRKELVGRLRRSWLSLFGDRWKRDAPIEISFVLPGTVADEKTSLTKVKTWRRCTKARAVPGKSSS